MRLNFEANAATMALLYFVCVFRLQGTTYHFTYKSDVGGDCALQTVQELEFTTDAGGELHGIPELDTGVSGCESLYVVAERSSLQLQLQVHLARDHERWHTKSPALAHVHLSHEDPHTKPEPGGKARKLSSESLFRRQRMRGMRGMYAARLPV